ncbi:MAG: HAD family hydrolase [Pseudobutyrivibrio sp.]|nr:HAD family hydrolase [Pseudobutyrivibrio sp.]
MVTHVYFDLDNTLYNFEEASAKAVKATARKAYEMFGLNEKEFIDLYGEYMHKQEREAPFPNAGMHSRVLRFKMMLEYYHLPVLPYAADLSKYYWESLIKDIKPEKGLVNLLKQLKAGDYFIGLGTNMQAYPQYKKLVKLGIEGYFDGLITSEEAAYEKPQREFFQFILDQDKVEADECLFLGDNIIHDVFPALEIGMRAGLYTPNLPEDRLKKYVKLAEEKGYKIKEYHGSIQDIGREPGVIHQIKNWENL